MKKMKRMVFFVNNILFLRAHEKDKAQLFSKLSIEFEKIQYKTYHLVFNNIEKYWYKKFKRDI